MNLHKEHKLVFQVAATYVGAVMGAGFASGQEIQQFFAGFGLRGLWGVGITTVLFAVIGWVILDLIQRRRINSYSELFCYIVGNKWGNRLDLVMTALLFIGMVAMLSGSGALFNQYFGMSQWVGIGLTATVVLVALLFRGEGVLWINTVLIPLKLVFCIGIALLAILFAQSEGGSGYLQPNILLRHWGVAAVLYVSFNLTFAMVVFASLGQEIRTSQARLGGVVGGLLLGLFALVIAIALIRFPEVAAFEIPMVAVSGKLGRWPAFFYMLVLWMAMITAAIGNGFSLAKRFSVKNSINYHQLVFALVCIVSPLAGIPFSKIVEFVYPVFGYIGVLIIPFILYGWFQSIRFRKPN